MGAYDTMEQLIAGMKYDLDGTVESWTANEDIEFGIPLFAIAGEEDICSPYYADVTKVVYDIDFEGSNSIAFSVDGVAITPVVYATSHAATMAALIAAIAGLTGVECVADATDVSNNTLLVRKTYTTYVCTTTVTGGSNQAVGTITYHSSMIFIGGCLRTQKEAAGTAKYLQYEAVNVITEGKLAGLTTSVVVSNNVLVGDGTGWNATTGAATTGKCRKDAASGALTLIQVDGQAAGTYSDIAFS